MFADPSRGPERGMHIWMELYMWENRYWQFKEKKWNCTSGRRGTNQEVDPYMWENVPPFNETDPIWSRLLYPPAPATHFDFWPLCPSQLLSLVLSVHGTRPQYGNTGCGVFLRGGTKLEWFLPKNQHPQRKLLNFENWVSGEVSKIRHHVSK